MNEILMEKGEHEFTFRKPAPEETPAFPLTPTGKRVIEVRLVIDYQKQSFDLFGRDGKNLVFIGQRFNGIAGDVLECCQAAVKFAEAELKALLPF